MKKIRMTMMALAAISGIGSAFAFSSSPKENATRYYAVGEPGDYQWTVTRPNEQEFSCQQVQTGVCSILTNTAPEDNEVPESHETDQKGLWMSIN